MAEVMKMAKNKTKRKSGFNTQSIFKIVRIAALALPAVAVATQPWSTGDKINIGVRQYFGFDMKTGKFSLGELAKGWGPFVAAGAVTYGIPKLMGMIRGL